MIQNQNCTECLVVSHPILVSSYTISDQHVYLFMFLHLSFVCDQKPHKTQTITSRCQNIVVLHWSRLIYSLYRCIHYNTIYTNQTVIVCIHKRSDIDKLKINSTISILKKDCFNIILAAAIYTFQYTRTYSC